MWWIRPSFFYMINHCCCLVAKLYPALCDPTDYSLPGSSVHGIALKEYWSGLPFPSPGDFPKPAIEPASPALQAASIPLSHQGSQWSTKVCTYFPSKLILCICTGKHEQKILSKWLYLDVNRRIWTALVYRLTSLNFLTLYFGFLFFTPFSKRIYLYLYKYGIFIFKMNARHQFPSSQALLILQRFSFTLSPSSPLTPRVLLWVFSSIHTSPQVLPSSAKNIKMICFKSVPFSLCSHHLCSLSLASHAYTLNF